MKVSWTKLNHSDKITIDKRKYVHDEAIYCGRSDLITQIANKHLTNIKYYCCVGEYSLNQDKICLLDDGLKYFMETNNNTLEKQIAKTISHEIFHRILFYEQGENATRGFDNIAEDLEEYGVY